MLARRGLFVAAAALTLSALAGGASASAPPTASVDVIAWPGEEAGPLQWKLWRVTANEPIRSVTLTLPPGALRERALRALMSEPQVPEGATAGEVTVTTRKASDAIGQELVPLLVNGCPGAVRGDLATLRFEAGGACTTVGFDAGGNGVVARIDLSASSVVALDLRLDSLQTPAGRLLPANPPDPFAADTSVAVETASGATTDAVREIVGGATSVTIGARETRILYGRDVTLSGRVTRGGAPAASELVAVGELVGLVANQPLEPSASVTTDAGGRFSVTVRPAATARWAAWARPRGVPGQPRLTTLAGVVPEDVVVRAPKPLIERRHARRVHGGVVRAEIIVRNPIARLETLQCRLYVGGDLLSTRRFPSQPAPLVFHLTGRWNTRVRAVIGRWTGPRIAGASSKVITLGPRRPRRP